MFLLGAGRQGWARLEVCYCFLRKIVVDLKFYD